MAGTIQKALLEQIRAASDIVDVIGSYIPLKRAGANWVALCPFHKEKTPSFNVNPQRQIFHCFGCHKGGDVFSFIREYESVGFMDAVRRLAERAKIPLAFESGPREDADRSLREVLLQIHEQITQRWQIALNNEAAGQEARDYLTKRGVSDEAIKLFRLGFSPDSWEDTVHWARSRSFNPGDVEKAGLVIRREEGKEPYGRFRGRLMFPICDEQGRVIAFSGRVLKGDEKAAKYVNSPETPIFAKSRVFYGLDKAKRALLDAEFAVVCEGQLDLIASFMAGIENVVAPQGTAFTSDHARILKRYVSEVVLCFDSDEAGQNAAIRSLDGLLESGLAIRVAITPAPHDPDSYIRSRGADAFRALIDDAPGFFDFLLDRVCREDNPATDRGRMAVIGAMAEAVWKTGNHVVVDTYAQKTALRLGVAAEAMRAEFQKLRRAGQRPTVEAAEEEVPEPERPSTAELWLLRLLLEHDDLCDWAAEHLRPDWIENRIIREIVMKRVVPGDDQAFPPVATLVDECEDPHAGNLITEAAARDVVIPNPARQLADITVKLRNASLDKRMAELTRQISQPEVSDEEKVTALRQQQEIRELKQRPLAAPET